MASSCQSLVLQLLVLCFLTTTVTSDLAADRVALLRLIPAVRGRTRRWNQSDSSPCTWSGVTCDPTTNRVTALRLPGGRLFGQIPPTSIGNLTLLVTLSLRRNSLSGPLPPDLAACTELRFLFLQENNFSGDIPESLFNLTNLVRLDLSRNYFTGEVPTLFNNLFRLSVLFLENNLLTGSLPELSNLSELTQFNVSFNRLNSSIPNRFSNFPASSFLGNSLCGSPLNSCQNGGNGNGNGNGNSLSAGAVAGIVVGSVAGSILLILAVVFILWRRFSSSVPGTPLPDTMPSIPPSPVKPLPRYDLGRPDSIIVRDYSDHSGRGLGRVASSRAESLNIKSVRDDGMVFFGEDGFGGFSLQDLLKASAEVLGKGTVGTTYKAYLENGGEVIVKRLKHVPVSEGEFREKIEGLGELVHENLVPLRGYYYGREEKLLVYDWIPMGNLSAILHGNRNGNREELTWEVRSSIAFQVARGIEYLHSLGPNVSHGNIKASNIFLTEQFGARVSEFGITHLVSSSTPNLLGYRAPEVVDSRKVSQEADVYSLGVLILELLSGKAPTDAMNEDGVDLPRWVQAVVKEKWTIDVFDPELLKYQNVEDEMVQLLHLGIHCTNQYPERRPEMMEVIAQIRKICGARIDMQELRPYQNEEG